MSMPNSAAPDARVFDVGSNLQDIADRLSELVGNPITIEGTDFQLIAHSRQVNNVDDVRKTTILERRVPEPVVRALWSRGIVNHLHSSRTAVRVEKLEAVGLADRVAIAVRMDDEVVAHIWVQEVNRPLQDNDMLLLRHAANMVALELLNIGYLRETKERMVANFLDELLVSTHIDEAEAQVRAARLGLSWPSPYQVIVLGSTAPAQDASVEAEQDATDADVADERSREFVRIATDVTSRQGIWSIATRQARHVTLITSTAKGEETDERYIAHAICDALVARGYDVLVSASAPAEGFHHVGHAYQDAMRCLRVALPLGWRNTVVTGSSLGVLQLLPLLSDAYEETFGGKPGHSRMERLLKEDQHQSGFSMVETIEALLDCGGDTKRTAQRLHIHVNTLNYRLRRIFERTGFDVNDGQERLAIHMELKLRRLVGKQDAAG